MKLHFRSLYRRLRDKMLKLFGVKTKESTPTLHEAAKGSTLSGGVKSKYVSGDRLTQPVGYFTYDKDGNVTGAGVKYPLEDKLIETAL